jgi:tRNA A-37 threonylcarbamoyl transferase component Bud32
MTVIAEVLGNRYEVGRLLGAGGMADVHEGVDRVLGRRVAIKIPHPQLARDPLFVARFKREATLAASLTHPGVVAVYDTGQDGDTSFIVMEYVEGATLAALLRAEGPLAPDRAAELVAEVCGALGAAHAKGLIHRDIKPGNIMCTGEGRVKVMDFGVARMLAASMTLTESAGIVGTAKYMSPEQAQGGPVDARSDLYSLGVVLYECLGGRPPFDGDSPVVIASRHVWATPAPLRELQPDVPPALEAVTYRALAKDPGERYQHAAELAEDLERARAGLAVAPPPPFGVTPEPGTAAAILAGHRAGATGPGSALAPAGADPTDPGLEVAGGQGLVPATGAAGPAPAGRRRRWPLALLTLGLLAGVAGFIVRGPLATGYSTPTSPTDAVGTTVPSDPPASGGAVAPPEDSVTSSSTPAARQPVPNVIGRTESDAMAALQAAGYAGEVVSRGYSTRPAGTVTRQSPRSGALPPSTRVRLVVSAGPRPSTSTTTPPTTSEAPPTPSSTSTTTTSTTTTTTTPTST